MRTIFKRSNTELNTIFEYYLIGLKIRAPGRARADAWNRFSS